VGSLLVQDVFTLDAGRELRTLGVIQHVHAPSPHTTDNEVSTARDSAVHFQSAYESGRNSARQWRVFGGYTARDRDADGPPPVRVADPLTDGPIQDLLAAGDSIERRWTVGARAIAPRHNRHTLSAGVEHAGSAVRTTALPDTVIGELVDGIAARVWRITTPADGSRRHAHGVSLFAGDRVALSPALTLDAGLSFESVTGSASGADGITWNTLLPRASLRWAIAKSRRIDLVTGYRRSANQLTLDLLSYGDPAGPTANVFRWERGQNPLAASTLVMRAGPGTGGDPAFTRIDPSLNRPHSDEFAISLESRPVKSTRLSVTGLAQREASLINVVNTGAPLDAYRPVPIADPNVDLVGTADDQQLIVYDRLPGTFGRDQYLLTNPPDNPATMGAVVLKAEVTTPRLSMLVGATASASVGPAGSRGFRSAENDQDAIGERWTSPNATTNARGRLFSDRAYTIKWATVYRFPHDVRLGAIARYEDGTPFARMVVVPDLAQGAETVRAFSNGRSRFAFTGTLDVRVQKGFVFRSMRVDGIVDVYNLLNLSKEVEEIVVTGPSFRTPIAVQPPRAMHVGVRVSL
jgi:hypothetical protein